MTIKKLVDKIFKRKQNPNKDIYKMRVHNSVRKRDIEELIYNLQYLECLNPKDSLAFLKNLLTELKDENIMQKATVDMFNELGGIIKEMELEYKHSNEDVKQKLNEMEANYLGLSEKMNDREQKLKKDSIVQDILKQAVDRFSKCPKYYHKELPKIFEAIIKRDIDTVTMLTKDIKGESKYVNCLIEQIRISYAVKNLNKEIRMLRGKNFLPNKTSIDDYIKLWELLKRLYRFEKDDIDNNGEQMIELRRLEKGKEKADFDI